MEEEDTSESTIVVASVGRTYCGRRSPHDSCWGLEGDLFADSWTHVDCCALFVFFALRDYATGQSLKRVLAMEVVNGDRHSRLWSLFVSLVCARCSIPSDLVN